MKADWEEILDMWEEKELAHFLPECLPAWMMPSIRELKNRHYEGFGKNEAV